MNNAAFSISQYLGGSAVANAVAGGAGFSFRYDGASFDGGRYTVRDTRFAKGEGTDKTTVVFENTGSPLRVLAEIVRYTDLDTVQHSVAFENCGDTPLDSITEFKSLDITIEASEIGELVFHAIKGGTTEAVYPSEAYRHEAVEIYPDLLDPYARGFWKDYRITTKGGLSSNLYFPLMLIQDRANTDGMFVSVGWSGQWEMKATKANDRLQYRISGGLCGFQVALQPGETVKGPNIYIGGYRGDVLCGSSLVRRLADRISAGHPNQKIPPTSFDQWFGYSTYFDEALMMRLADASAELGLEYFVMDAGWFPGCDKVKPVSGFGFFSTGVGNWTVDEKKFPGGLKPVAEYVRSKGLKFGLWFEPERVYRETNLAQRREWLLECAGKPYSLLDLGNPEARRWLKEMLARYIEDLDIRWLRYDCNLSPLAFWEANDAPERKGMSEIRHIEGLYEIWDWLNHSYPGMILEGCASGGRRIDFEAVKRCHLFVSSDQNLNPHLVRNHLHGANRILPGRFHNVIFGPNLLTAYPDAYYHSYFGGSLQISDPILLWDEGIRQTTRRHLAVYKKIRHLINEDFSLPFGDPTELTKWQGWQHYKGDGTEGVLVAFRLRAGEGSVSVPLRGIDPALEYTLEDPYTGTTEAISGSELSRGLRLTLEPNESQVVYYKSR